MKLETDKVLAAVRAGESQEDTLKVKAIQRVKMRMIEDFDNKIQTLQPLLRETKRSGYILGLNDALDWVEKFNRENR